MQPYPFARLRPVSLCISKPRHATPDFIVRAYAAALERGLASYPATGGDPALRQACARWVQGRYGVALDPARQVLPVLGSRALYAQYNVTVLPGH